MVYETLVDCSGFFSLKSSLTWCWHHYSTCRRVVLNELKREIVVYALLFYFPFPAETGVLVSPYYPMRYPDNKHCYYTIRQVPGNVITLTFVDFSIEHEADCNFDYIEVIFLVRIWPIPMLHNLYNCPHIHLRDTSYKNDKT